MSSHGESAVKKTLRELETTYKLHSHFRDVVVEGRDDAALIRWYLNDRGVPNVRVYAIDDRVKIADEIVAQVHPEVNNRGKVIGLASVAESWSLREESLTCVIDADFDWLNGPQTEYSVLLRTDFAAMEIYSLQDRPLTKFLIAAAKSDMDATSVVSLLKPAWAVIYTLRYVLHSQSTGVGLVKSFASKTVVSASQVVTDARDLLRSSGPSITGDLLESLLDLHAQYLDKIPHDTLHGIRGHDAAPLMIRFLGLKNDMAVPKNVENLLRMSLESADLDGHELFKSLISRTFPRDVAR